MVASFQNLYDLSLRQWGSLQPRNEKNRELADIFQQTIQADTDETWLKLTGLIQQEERFVQLHLWQVVIYLLDRMGTYDLLKELVILWEKGRLPLSGMVPIHLQRREIEKVQQQVTSIVLGNWLNGELNRYGYPPNLYIDRMQMILDELRSRRQRRIFLNYFKFALDLQVKLDEWLDGVLTTIADHPAYVEKCDPKEMLKLSFHEVEPFLQQYCVALCGNIPMEISENGVPTFQSWSAKA